MGDYSDLGGGYTQLLGAGVSMCAMWLLAVLALAGSLFMCAGILGFGAHAGWILATCGQ